MNIDPHNHEPDDHGPFRPVIRSQADLEQAWRRLMGPLGFSTHTMWVMLIDPDDRPFPQLIEVVDAVADPTPEEQEAFAGFLRHFPAEPGGRLAFLLSRPGRNGVGPTDRRWAASVYDACRAAPVVCEVIHLANDATLVPIPMDDVLLPAAG